MGEGSGTANKDAVINPDWQNGIPQYPRKNGDPISNNVFFGGNLWGVIEKLDYLESLGVTVLYLSPIFKAYSNHRYDAGDFMKIDGLLGTDNDFKTLCEKANEYGIKIVLDGVFNHTGDDSVYFNKYGKYNSVGAYQSENSPYYSWYTFKKYPDEYTCWWDILILPTINKNSIEFEDFIAGDNGVIEKYMRLGASGYRLDVVDELPSRFVKKIRSKIKSENPNAVLIGEVWEDATYKIAYDTRKEYFLGNELDSVMNYPLKNAIIDYVLNKNATELNKVVSEQINNYPKQALDSLMNILDTHDTARILTVLGRKIKPKTREEMSTCSLDENSRYFAKLRLKIAVLLQFTLYGVPSIYYGDEVGVEGESDPFNRACYPWGREDKNLLAFYKKISKIRNDSKVFKEGDVEVITAKDGVFVFKRVLGNESVVIACNVGEYKYDIIFDNKVTELFTKTKNNKFTLDKLDFKIFNA